MFNTPRVVSAIVIAGGLIAAPACAAQRSYTVSQRDFRDVERRAYDDGYRQGVDHGQRDARERRDFKVDRDRVYRDADDRGRDRDGVRRVFRDGYREGYTEGYNRVAQVEGRRFYPNAPGVSTERGRAIQSPAAQVGFRDGLEAGRDDAKDRRGFEPRRSKRYRDGDRDYNKRFGSRDEYKDVYRAAFTRGYEEGYRGFRR